MLISKSSRAGVLADSAPVVKWAAAILLALDGVLLGINVVHHLVVQAEVSGIPFDNLFAWIGWFGAKDGSVLEIVGHIQLLMAAILLVVLARRIRQRVYLGWAFAFLVLALDDYYMWHENFGGVFERFTGVWTFFGLRSLDVGELLFFAVFVAVWGGVIYRFHRLAPAAVQRSSLAIAVAALLPGIVSLVLDMVSIVIQPYLSGVGWGLVTTAETAAEIVGMSLILIVVIYTLSRSKVAGDLWEMGVR